MQVNRGEGISIATVKIDKGFIKHLDFILADLLCLQIAFFLANLLRFVIFGSGNLKFDSLYRSQAFLLAFCLLASLTFGAPYKDILRRSRAEELKRLTSHACNMALLNIVALYFLHTAGAMSRWLILLTWPIYYILEISFRLNWKRILQRKHKAIAGKNAMIVMSTSLRAGALIRDTSLNPLGNYFISAIFLDDYREFKEMIDERIKEGLLPRAKAYNEEGQFQLMGVPILGDSDAMIRFASHNWADEVMIGIGIKDPLRHHLISSFREMELTVHDVVAELHNEEDITDAMQVERMGHLVVETRATRFVDRSQVVMKRIMDICGALVGLFLTGIIYLFVAPAIKKADPGPVFFSQVRVGRNGKKFKMHKFRSMYQDAEARKAELLEKNKIQDGFMFKMDDDPRIIGSEKKDKDGNSKGIGNFIRKTSLDEFPQFLNVLKGDMSLVGTRPPTLDEYAKYSPHHRARMSMRPGITGMWQISGRSNIDDFEKVVELDTQYIQTWTVGMDVRILARTVASVLKHEGAE